MRLSQAWIITAKDLQVFRRKTSLMTALVAFPAGVALGLPAVLWFIAARHRTGYATLIPFFNAFLFFFLIGTVFLSNSLASYSIVGEKVEKSLEPLLATPTSDDEILMGKTLAAFVPTIAATFLGATAFMALVDALSAPQLGYFYYPNWTMGVLLLLAMPLACLFSVEVIVLVSSRVTDVRAAQQIGGLVVLPFAGLYVLGEISAVQLTEPTLLDLSGLLLLADLALFYVSRAAFRREEILTQWK
jgi:ABC-2 type transport system permease protein